MMAPDVMGPGYGEGSSWNPVPPQLPPQMQAPSQQQPPQQHQHQHQPQMQTHLQHQHQTQMQQMGQQQGISPQQMMQAPSQQPQQQMTQHYVVQHHPGHPHHQHHQFPYHPQHPHHQFNPQNQHHHGRVYKPRPSPIPFDDGQILLPSFVSSLSSASARSSSPRSFTASTLLYPLPEDEEAMLQVLEIPHLPNDAAAAGAIAGGDQSSAMMTNGNGGGASSTSASGMPADFGDPSQFVPSQHSAFRTPLSRPIPKKPDGQQAMRPHSPQHVMPSGAGAGATHNHQHQHQHQHNHQHQFQQHLQHQHIMHQQHTNAGISPHQLQMPVQQQQPPQPQQFQQPQAQLQGQQLQQSRPVVLDREQQLLQVEGILRDAHSDNSSACSKKDIEIFTHHAAMQRMAHESIKKRIQLHQQQQQQQGQSSPSSSSSPDIGQQGSDGQPAAKKSKSNRSRTDQAQYQQLEDVFLRDPLPSRKTKERLAQELGLTARKVQVWFQNRRAKERRQLREMGINDSTILPNPWGE
ncbi:homeobox domain containing protein [Acanthamoeba castellanii str. Neff]|uniref:Homeobox domain containing protein n=1 Tax=Acanthamoeba castellanii (strain ATCC 30010 / Neff) TaxID=1257118 RepID=L8HB27_ACACF|nr:homeobox domain containing protein [Acanthamoeba castellanii str. Neff]ELR21938.1 homeobox domain containing protein [Acanthamoeba castellanii str. Neff]